MNNWQGAQALEYHERTKHSYVSVRLGSRRLDWENYPYPFKVYRETEGLSLPRSFPRPEAPLLGRGSRAPPDINLVAELLFYSAGITRIKRYPGMAVYFRAASATGALYETELYVINGPLEGLEPGVYHFDPGEFGLDVLRRGDHRWALYRMTGEEELRHVPFFIALSSLAWRNAWKYEARSYRHWFWDAGTIIANLLAVSWAEGLEARLLLGFLDDELNRLLGLDGRQEAAIALLALGSGAQAAQEGRLGQLLGEVLPLSRSSVRYPLIEEAYESSKLRGAEDLGRWREACASGIQEEAREEGIRARISLPEAEPMAAPLWEVILRRGSTREFSRRPIGLRQLSSVLRTLSSPLPCDFLLSSRSLLHVYLIANAVEGLEPGAYYFDEAARELGLLRAGGMRDFAAYLCLEQPLAGDASAVLFFMSDLGRIIAAFGNRGYRACQLEAGIRAGLAYLAAYSLGLGATGLTFYDDDVREFFMPHSRDRECMLVVALGLPAYRARPGRIYAGAVRHDRSGPIARSLS